MTNTDAERVFSADHAFGERNVFASFDLPSEDAVHALGWSPDGKMLLATSKQGSFASIYHLHDKALDKPILISSHGVSAKGAVLYDDGSFIAPVSGISSNRSSVTAVLTRFNPNGKKSEPAYSATVSHELRDLNILAMSASASGKVLAFTGVDTTAKSRGLPLSDQWPAVIMTLAPERIFSVSKLVAKEDGAIVRSVALSATGDWASVLSNAGQANIWSRATGRLADQIHACQPRSMTCNMSLISSDGKYVIVDGDSDEGLDPNTFPTSRENSLRRLQLWSVKDKRVVDDLYTKGDMTPRSFDMGVLRSDDKEVAIASSSSFAIWSLKDGKSNLKFARSVPKKQDGRVVSPISAMAYSKDGMLAVAVGNHVVIYR